MNVVELVDILIIIQDALIYSPTKVAFQVETPSGYASDKQLILNATLTSGQLQLKIFNNLVRGEYLAEEDQQSLSSFDVRYNENFMNSFRDQLRLIIKLDIKRYQEKLSVPQIQSSPSNPLDEVRASLTP